MRHGAGFISITTNAQFYSRWITLRWFRYRLTLNEERKLNHVAEVVVAVDARLMKLTSEVVLNASYDDVGVHGEQRDKR